MENKSNNSNRFSGSFINTERKFDFASYFKDDDPRKTEKAKDIGEENKPEMPDTNYSVPFSVPKFSKFGPVDIPSSGFNEPTPYPEQQNQFWNNQQPYGNYFGPVVNAEVDGSYTINVPAGVRYLSDWEDFNFSRFSDISIINKEIPGCGMTEYSLTGPEYVILCSPRKLLLQNKKDQHGNDVFLVVNEMERDICVDVDINNNKKSSSTVSKIISKNDQIEMDRSRNEEVYSKIFREFNDYIAYMNGKPQYFTPYKILVTYDSYHIIKDILIRLGIFDKFYTVVDEFQSVLHDARFKSTTELGFLRDLGLSEGYLKRKGEIDTYRVMYNTMTEEDKKRYTRNPLKVLFVSATPILEEYIKQLKSFNDIPYYTLDWYKNDPSRIVKPDLNVNYMSSINAKSKEIINSYLSGKFDSVFVVRDNQPIEVVSTEAVFYVNSVSTILNIISNNKLTPDQVNILCANTEDNRKKIKAKLGKGFDIGFIPVRGQQNKMFTFCTRTVYLGADFYSKCAKSFIFSDSNSDCLSVDISEDLPQILGRQRDNDNPWKNSADFFYKTTVDYKRMTQEDFDIIINKKKERTQSLLNLYNKTSTKLDEKMALAENCQTVAKTANYRNDYVSVDTIIEIDPFTNEKREVLKPVVNDLVMVNEIRSFRIQQIDYKDRFTVFTSIDKKFDIKNSYDITNQISKSLTEFFGIYDQYTTAYSKLKFLCEFSKKPTSSSEVMNAILSQIPDSDELKSAFTILGPDRIYNLGYNMTKVRRELGIVVFDPALLVDGIYSIFKEGDSLSLSDIKNDLSRLYNALNYSKTPKATDLSGYFEIQEVYLYEKKEDGSKKKSRGFKLVKSYEDRIRLEMKMTK